MDDIVDDPPESGTSSSYRPVTINGRIYSQTHSYRLRKEERDRKSAECRARAEQVRTKETESAVE